MTFSNFFDVGSMGIEHVPPAGKGLVAAGSASSARTPTPAPMARLGAFSTGVGSTDMAAGMATGKAWFKVPAALRFRIDRQARQWVSGKDVILHIIGMIGVDGALYKSMEFTGDGLTTSPWMTGSPWPTWPLKPARRTASSRWMRTPSRMSKAIPSAHTRFTRPIRMRTTTNVYEIDLSNIQPTVAFPHLPDNTQTIDEVGAISKSTRWSSAPAPTGGIEDYGVAAKILQGKKVAHGVRAH